MFDLHHRVTRSTTSATLRDAFCSAAPRAAFCTAALLAAFCATLSAPLTAQTAADGGNRFVPEDSTMILRVASPAKWAERFGKTQAAKLLQGQSLAPFVQQITQSYEMGMDELRRSGAFDPDLVKGLLTEWKGDILVAMNLDWQQMAEAMQYGDPPPIRMVVALSPDGKYDFQKLAEEYARAAEDQFPEGTSFRDLTVGDRTLRTVSMGEGRGEFTLPEVIDGHLVLLGGTSLDEHATRMLATDGRHAGAMGDAPFYLHMQLDEMVSMIMDAVAQAPTPIDAVGLVEALGLGAIHDLTLSLDADEQHVVGAASLGLAGKQRGLFALLPQGAQRPRLLGAVPANVDAFSVTPLDLSAGLGIIETIWRDMEDMTPASWDEVMQGFAEGTKVRLQEDLLAHLGKELLMVQDTTAMSFDEDELEENPAAFFGGTVLGIALDDGAAFGKSLETAMRSRGMHVGRKTQDYADVKIHRMKLAGLVDLEYVVTDDLMLLAIGGDDGTQRVLRSVLDARAAGGGELPENVKGLVEGLPPGWCGVSASPIASTLSMLAEVAERSGELDAEGQMFASVLANMCKDMQRLGIGSMVSATYVSDSSITSRFRW